MVVQVLLSYREKRTRQKRGENHMVHLYSDHKLELTKRTHQSSIYYCTLLIHISPSLCTTLLHYYVTIM